MVRNVQGAQCVEINLPGVEMNLYWCTYRSWLLHPECKVNNLHSNESKLEEKAGLQNGRQNAPSSQKKCSDCPPLCFNMFELAEYMKNWNTFTQTSQVSAVTCKVRSNNTRPISPLSNKPPAWRAWALLCGGERGCPSLPPPSQLPAVTAVLL